MIDASYTGGENGTEYFQSIFAHVKRCLVVGGLFYFLLVEINGLPNVLQNLVADDWDVAVVAKKRFYNEDIVVIKGKRMK